MSFTVPQKPTACTDGPQSQPAWQAGLRMSAWFFDHWTFDIGNGRSSFARRLSASFSGLRKRPSMWFEPFTRYGFTSKV